MEDKTQTDQVQTASMNRTKAPQKVEVVVANSSSGSEVNILGELSIFILRIGFCSLMIHHGLEKLQDPQGFAEFVVGKYFPFSDTVELANEYGIKAIIQPGGSLRDQDSIDMCDSQGISMVFTQKRHFLH